MRHIIAIIIILLILIILFNNDILNKESFDMYYNHDLWAADYQGLPRGPIYNTWRGRQQTHQDMFDKYYEHILRENNPEKNKNAELKSFTFPNRLPVRNHITGDKMPYMAYMF